MPRERIMIMAGGTGGHVYPALAVANCLRQQGIELLWLGTDKGLESELVEKHGFTLCRINIGGLRGKGIARLLIAPALLCRALYEAMCAIHRFKPDAILGMGGYASGPGGIAAWISRIPLYIHEQNAIAGMTNRILAPLAKMKLAGFPGAFAESSSVEVTGNPVRQEIVNLSNVGKNTIDFNERPLSLLILGGSQGALALNTTVPRVLNKIGDDVEIKVWHQSGKQHLDKTRSCYEKAGLEHARVDAYITDMAEAYEWADLVLCRSGALTLAEVCVAGLASILVPFPYAVDDHQTANARVLSENGAAVLLPEPELESGKLEALITSLYQAPATLQSMAEKTRAIASPNAAARVASICLGGSNA